MYFRSEFIGYFIVHFVQSKGQLLLIFHLYFRVSGYFNRNYGDNVTVTIKPVAMTSYNVHSPIVTLMLLCVLRYSMKYSSHVHIYMHLLYTCNWRGRGIFPPKITIANDIANFCDLAIAEQSCRRELTERKPTIFVTRF